MNKNYKDLLYLLSCAVNGITPDTKKVHAMDLEQLYRLAKFHSVRAAVYITLKRAGVQNNNYDQAYKKAVRKNIYLDMERSAIIDDFEQQGIWYMPLKGSVLKDLYPENGMREMSDNDIFFDADKREQSREIMLAHGYTAKEYGESNHDAYHKPPVLSLELHTALFDEKYANNPFFRYYADAKRLLQKDEDNNYGYHFSDEDFYVFMTTHEWKHFSNSGTGVRSLLDCYVYCKAKGESLDWNYIKEQCKMLEIADFEQERRALALKVFSSDTLPNLSDSEQKMLMYYLSAGTYGTLENNVNNKLKDHTKAEYILSQLFPSVSYMKQSVKYVRKYPILYPVGIVYRWGRILVKRRDLLKKTVKIVNNHNPKKKKSYKTFLWSLVGKISTSPFSKLAAKSYDCFVMLEYLILSGIWRIKANSHLTDDEKRYVAQNVTFIYKSFERQNMAKRLFKSIQKYYPGSKVIIADDSKEPLIIKSEYADVIHLPFNSGLSYGLNQALARVNTPYTFRMDDDELLTPISQIYEQLKFLEEHTEVDLVGLQVCSAPFPKKIQKLANMYTKFDMKEAPKPLIIPHMTRIDKNHYIVGKIANIFLVRTDKFKSIGYDDNIKRIDHHEFFYRAAGNIVSAMDISALVFHYHNWFDGNYAEYRNDWHDDIIYIREKRRRENQVNDD